MFAIAMMRVQNKSRELNVQKQKCMIRKLAGLMVSLDIQEEKMRS